MKGLLVLFLYINLSQANLLCSTNQMTWYDAMNSCRNLNGRPLKISSKYADLIKYFLKDDVSIWTSEYIYQPFMGSCYPGHLTRVCGYGYIHVYESMHTHITDLETQYGPCHVDKFYICNTPHIGWQLLSGYFDEAILCPVVPGDNFFHVLTSGYYWTNISKEVCTKPYDISYGYVRVVGSYNLCRAYENAIGSFYVNCTSQRYMICDFENEIDLPEGYRECINDQPRTTDNIRRIPPIKSTIITSYSVTTATNKLNTKDGQSDEQSGNDLGVKVGVPMAVCIFLFIVVTIVIISCRRYRRKQNATTGNSCVDGKPQSTSHNKPDVIQRIMFRMVAKSDNSGNNVADDTYDYTSDDSEETEYGSIHDVKVDAQGLHGRVEEGKYDTTTDKRQQHKTSDDYDTLQSDDINFVSGTYDTTNQRHPNHTFLDDYDHLNNVTTESDYDTTRPVGQVAVTTDDTYNRLDCVDGSKKLLYV